MGKTKTKSRSVGDSPKPPITIRSTNPKILDDNIAKLEKAIQASDVSANPSGTAEDTLLSSIGIDGKKYEIGPSAVNTLYDNTDSGLTADKVQGAIDEVVDIMKQVYSNLDITNSIGGTEVNKATLYAAGNIGFLVFAWTCQNNESERLTIALPTGWSAPIRGGLIARDNTNGNLVSVYFSNNELNTYNHVGTMTVGNSYSVICPVIK